MLEIETRDPDPILPKRMVGALMVEPRSMESRSGPDGFALAADRHRALPARALGPTHAARACNANPYRWRESHISRASNSSSCLKRRPVRRRCCRETWTSRCRDRGARSIWRPRLSRDRCALRCRSCRSVSSRSVRRRPAAGRACSPGAEPRGGSRDDCAHAAARLRPRRRATGARRSVSATTRRSRRIPTTRSARARCWSKQAIRTVSTHRRRADQLRFLPTR